MPVRYGCRTAYRSTLHHSVACSLRAPDAHHFQVHLICTYAVIRFLAWLLDRPRYVHKNTAKRLRSCSLWEGYPCSHPGFDQFRASDGAEGKRPDPPMSVHIHSRPQCCPQAHDMAMGLPTRKPAQCCRRRIILRIRAFQPTRACQYLTPTMHVLPARPASSFPLPQTA